MKGKQWEMMGNVRTTGGNLMGKFRDMMGNMFGKLMDNVKEIVGKLRETYGTGKPWENLTDFFQQVGKIIGNLGKMIGQLWCMI